MEIENFNNRKIKVWNHISSGKYSCDCGYTSRRCDNFCSQCGAIMNSNSHWIHHKAIIGSNSDTYTCARCRVVQYKATNFCHNCGAAMQNVDNLMNKAGILNA